MTLTKVATVVPRLRRQALLDVKLLRIREVMRSDWNGSFFATNLIRTNIRIGSQIKSGKRLSNKRLPLTKEY